MYYGQCPMLTTLFNAQVRCIRTHSSMWRKFANTLSNCSSLLINKLLDQISLWLQCFAMFKSVQTVFLILNTFLNPALLNPVNSYTFFSTDLVAPHHSRRICHLCSWPMPSNSCFHEWSYDLEKSPNRSFGTEIWPSFLNEIYDICRKSKSHLITGKSSTSNCASKRYQDVSSILCFAVSFLYHITTKHGKSLGLLRLKETD